MTVVNNSSPCFGEDDQRWPPGFRFSPTDEELVVYYLKRKICRRRPRIDIIAETDVYKWNPEELPGLSKLKTGDRLWFFFSPRDRKYPNGARSNRATRQGYWKATGKDRSITCNSRPVGVKKTLVFYKGRAPSGERTDWVMHEYTLDEEELKRCPTAQDYYALYKVFKKSGPGPKNGEQYGAPFREEEWADDENSNVDDLADLENSLKRVNDTACVDNTRTKSQVQPPVNDPEEFMSQLADEPGLVQPFAVDYGFIPQEVVGEEETPSTLVDQSLREANMHERSMVIQLSRQQNDALPSFDLTQSTTSQLQLHETSEVTSAPIMCRQDSNDPELADFIEMDDLLGPGPAIQNIEKPVENLQYEEIDGLSELDLFQDASMFLQDMGPLNPDPLPHPYFDNIGNTMVNQLDYQLQPHSSDESQITSQLWFHNQQNPDPLPHPYFDSIGNEMVNQLDYCLQPHSSDESQITSQLWFHNQQDVFTPADYNQGVIPPPTSGVVCDGSSANFPAVVNQNQNEGGREDNGGDSWFSSSLWSFVESIPTTPASASESAALVNRAFERMSSFGRMGVGVKISAGDTSAAAGDPAATPRKASSRYSRGIFLFSVLGVVCAILWVLIGTSMTVLRRCISS